MIEHSVELFRHSSLVNVDFFFKLFIMTTSTFHIYVVTLFLYNRKDMKCDERQKNSSTKMKSKSQKKIKIKNVMSKYSSIFLRWNG